MGMDITFNLRWNPRSVGRRIIDLGVDLTTRLGTVSRAFALRVALASVLAGLALGTMAQELPRPAEIEPDIHFWTRVYTEVDTNGGFLHDSRDLSVVYRTIRFADGASRRTRSRQMRSAQDEIREALRTLGNGKRDNLTQEQARVLEMWPEGVSNRELSAAASRVRFQLGQADRYRAGYIRAGRWKPYIREVLREEGVPAELISLPHVESSFDPTAYSKVGAAGMWQFTRSTGLRYMRIDHIVDERRDPYLATVAAAQLLRDNYDVLQNWALAITAYNHGQAGMRNAVRRTGTDRIEVILREYDGRAFGFASRNFYVAFLAASDVDANAEEYFGPLTPHQAAEPVIVEVPDFLTASTLAAAFDMSHRELRSWNPALTEAVWTGDKFVPKGYGLRLPAALAQESSELLASVPEAQRYTAQKPDIMHRVRRGDTISGIADRYRISQASLVALNNLRSRNFIREGQILRLPGNDGTTPITLAELNGEVNREPNGELTGSGSVYVVRAGDSIDRISRMFGVSPGALQAQNGIVNANRIYPGQELRIGGAGQADSVTDAGLVAAAATESAPPSEVQVAEVEAQTAAAVESPVAAAVESEVAAVVEPQVVAAIDSQVAAAAESAVAAVVEPQVAVIDALLPAAATEPEAQIEAAPEAEVALAAEPGPIQVQPPYASAADQLAVEATLAVIADSGIVDPQPGLEEVFEDALAESLEANVLASEQAEMAADPSDYLVREDQTIEVQALETLGHYADWLEIRTQRLRDINSMPFRRAVVIGHRLKLDFSQVSAERFEARRIAYQQQTQEAFFLANQVTDTLEHVVRSGESLWVLALRRYQVPVWLVRQYNPDLDLDRVMPGTVVKFPELRPIAEVDNGTRAAN